MAACQSLDEKSKNYNKAIELYQECLKIDPDNLAFYNNLAKNYIEIEDFMLAATFLNDIKQKWNHPAIYFNLAVAYQRGKVTDPRLLDDAVQKMEQYRKNYPQFQAQHQKGLIHTFLLQPDQNYNDKQIKQLDQQILQSVITFQNMIHMKFDIQQLIKMLQVIHPKITRRAERQQIYGIRMNNSIKAFIQVLETFRAKLISSYKPQYKTITEKHYLQALIIINNNIFEAKIQNSINYQDVYQSLVESCLIQLEVIAKAIQTDIVEIQKKKKLKENKVSHQQPPVQNGQVPIEFPDDDQQLNNNNYHEKFHSIIHPVAQNQDQELNALKLKDQEVRKKQKRDRQDIFQRPVFPQAEYQFKSRLADAQQFLAQYHCFIHQTLRVQNQSEASFFFLIIHLKQHNMSSYHVFYNNNRIKAQLTQAPHLPNLQNVQTHAQRTDIVKYYHIIRLIFKFYNFFGTNNFQYKLKDKITSLNINHYITLITPVLNQFFEEDSIFGKTKFGWLLNQIHFALSQYFQSTSENTLKKFKQLLQRINIIQMLFVNASQALMNDILKKNNQCFKKQLLHDQLVPKNQSTKEQAYFDWKINRYHRLNRNKDVRSAFKKEDDFIISQVSVYLITMAEKPLTEDKTLLAAAFSDCFHKASDSYKKNIFRKFFTSNHEISAFQKISNLGIKAIKILNPFE